MGPASVTRTKSILKGSSAQNILHHSKMIKLVCLFALVAVVASMPNGPMAPMRHIVKREAVAPEATQAMVEEDAPAQKSAVEAQDDMDKAETFGFGYRKVIHVGVPYYAPYHYYPRYYHGYHGYHGYGHYW